MQSWNIRRPGRVVVAFMAVLAAAACSTGGPAKPGVAGLSDPAAAGATPDQRLQVLEAGLQQLTRRMDALQAAVESGRAGQLAAMRDEQRPAEYRPLRPGIVPAAHPVRRPALPAVEPVSAPPPVPAPAPVERQSPARQPPGRGDWVINLASYTSRSYAARKLAQFVGAGVAAEQVPAEVNGATVYRLQVPGYASYREASAQAVQIRTQLGLDSTWVARR